MFHAFTPGAGRASLLVNVVVTTYIKAQRFCRGLRTLSAEVESSDILDAKVAKKRLAVSEVLFIHNIIGVVRPSWLERKMGARA